MSTYRLGTLFNPRSIAIVGASPRPGSVGLTFLKNLIAGGFPGAIYLVNPHHRQIEGRPCFAAIAALPETPDLVVVAVPPRNVLDVVEDAGKRGVAAAIITTTGLGYGTEAPSNDVRLAARRYGLRVVGPNCIGILSPRARHECELRSA